MNQETQSNHRPVTNNNQREKQIMRTRTAIVAWIAGALFALAGVSAQATILFQDDFSSPATGAPDPTKWDIVHPSNGTVTNGGGMVTVKSSGGAIALESKAAFSYGEFRITLSSLDSSGGAGLILGLNSASNSTVSADAVWIRGDGGLGVYSNGVSMGIATVGPVAPSVYTFTYLPNFLAAYRDTTLVFSTTDPAKIPDEGLHFEILTYGAGNTLVVDQVSYDDLVPEPSTAILLGVGALLVLRRQKRGME